MSLCRSHTNKLPSVYTATNYSLRVWLVCLPGIIALSLLIVTSLFYALAGFFGFMFLLLLVSDLKARLSFTFFTFGTLIISLLTFRLGGRFFNVSDFMYLLSAVLVCFHSVAQGNNLTQLFFKDNPLIMPLMLFLLGAILSMINSNTLMDDFMATGKYLFMFGIWLPLGISLHSTVKRVKLLLISLVIASLFPIIICISDYFLDTNLTDALNQVLSLNLPAPSLKHGRFGTIMGHPNHFGYLLAVVFPIGMATILIETRLSVKILGLLFNLGVLTCCAITGSRSALLSISLEAILLPCFLMRKRIAIRTIVSAMLVVSIIWGFVLAARIMPQSPMARFEVMLQYTYGGYSPDKLRLISMKKAWNYIKDNPICGIGVGYLNPTPGGEINKLRVHNTILRLWATIGVFGLVAVLWLYGKPVLTALSLRKGGQDREIRIITGIIFSSMAGWILYDMVQPQLHNRVKWLTVIALFAINEIRKKDQISNT